MYSLPGVTRHPRVACLLGGYSRAMLAQHVLDAVTGVVVHIGHDVPQLALL
jgi:hypothetical protein